MRNRLITILSGTKTWHQASSVETNNLFTSRGTYAESREHEKLKKILDRRTYNILAKTQYTLLN
jgi:hypothetical protein